MDGRVHIGILVIVAAILCIAAIWFFSGIGSSPGLLAAIIGGALVAGLFVYLFRH
ncbi:hypothetical protein C8N32_101348 [Rhodovulum imhoffii]|uniref:Uncharacterized protein n=1 Tax=Rhodovulum imhoffii TaxID=365340 RepID=A0A2T5BWZ0_9RHOB|nr:hypothetical protein C8N32_101348 [Rhodovulum imhoffii]